MKHRVLGPFPVLLALVLAGGMAGLTPRAVRAQPAPYAVTITGIDDDALRGLLEATSQLRQLQGQPPPSPAGLRRRADADRERLDTVLRAEAYYDAHVTITVAPGAPASSVTIAITPGRAYRFGRVTVTASGHDALPAGTPGAAALGLGPEAVAQAAQVVTAERRLIAALADHGLAFARISSRQAEIDRDTKTMDVTLTVTPGPVVRLGRIQVDGLVDLDPAVMQGRVAWVPGELYRPELLEKTRAALIKLGVFGSVRLEPAHQPDADGTHAVTITVTERKRRYVGVGVTFTNAEGLGAETYWGHRNLFGGGEQFRLGAEISRLNIRTLNRAGLDQADETLSAELRSPGVLAANQDMVLSTAAINEHPEAYQRQAETAGVRLERRLAGHLSVGYGLAGEQSDIRDTSGFTNATLAGTPVSLAYDTTDAILDPGSGYRLTLESTPWLRIGDAGESFVVNRVTQSLYQSLLGDDRLVAAGRMSLGSILNSTTADLPADKRFYAGGGGSVRGYAYQKIGPVDASGHPEGGRSLAEIGAEMRIKVTDSLGVVPFLDGGNVYDSALPQPGQTLRFGTGLGMRYYSGFGPLRLDLGVPLQPRRTDQPVQVYLSLGQAF